ncbi:hypothetical protein [Streptomyces sp. NPDC044948]|uniref:hypothetical protein n=1 Tax=Streptomyces sp. NPDC044948 TaxID=3157092 RepID=UPI0033FF5E74
MPVESRSCLYVVTALLGILLGLAVAVLSTPDPATPPRPRLPEVARGGEQDHISKVDKARQQTFQGFLVHTQKEELDLVADEPHLFQAQVLGAWHQTKPGTPRRKVQAGTEIGVRLHCSGAKVSCTRLSSERQNVLTKADVATWMWEVTAKQAGKVSLTVTVTSYLGGTKTVLFEKPPFTVQAEVAEAPEDRGLIGWVKDAYAAVKAVLTEAGVLAGIATTVAILYFALKNRRSPTEGLEAGDSGTPSRTPAEPTQPSQAQGATTQPTRQPVTTPPAESDRPRPNATAE